MALNLLFSKKKLQTQFKKIIKFWSLLPADFNSLKQILKLVSPCLGWLGRPRRRLSLPITSSQQLIHRLLRLRIRRGRPHQPTQRQPQPQIRHRPQPQSPATKIHIINTNPLLQGWTIKTFLAGSWQYLITPIIASYQRTRPTIVFSTRTKFKKRLAKYVTKHITKHLGLHFKIPRFDRQLKPISSRATNFIQLKHRQLRQLVSLPKWKTIIIAAVITIVATSGYSLYALIFKDLPSPQELTQRDQIVTTRIMDRHGQVLFRIYEDENRTLVTLDQIPNYMVNATVAIEDKNFYYHHGFSIRGILRAAIANSQEQEIQQGGSTITQQLVKNRLLNSEKTLKRKLREVVLSVLVEKMYTKDEILEMYFNQVAYGGATYGVEEAAQRYFDKSVSELSLAESSLLAGLPAAPSVYSPFGSTPELAKQRQQEVLWQMVDEGYITAEKAVEAYQQPLNFRQDIIGIQAPHFVMYVKKLLAAEYGEDVVNQGGLEVTTTLDLPLQTTTQDIVSQEVEQLKRLRVNNGAALVTNPQTGEILAMVGSSDYFDFAHDGQVNVTLRPRQPGSSIKPLTYAIALEQGKTPSTIIDDSPITYSMVGSPAYSPKNYDGKFHGRVTVREALASSYNVPAVKTLAEIGVNTMIDKGQMMGIDTWQDRSRFGLSLTLGGGEVTMTDMAEVYSTFANYGYTTELNPILEVKNYKGEVLYQNECALYGTNCPRQRNLDPRVAYQITDILADNQARTPAFGPRSVLYIPGQQVAVKTGTTNNLRDNWTIGYTSDRLVATWVGNNDNTPMSYVASGITGASPIWNQIMLHLLDEDQPHVFPTPDGFIKVKICVPTGTLPCTGCPVVKEELFKPGTEPTQACSPSWFQSPPASPSPTDPHRNQILEGLTNNPNSP